MNCSHDEIHSETRLFSANPEHKSPDLKAREVVEVEALSENAFIPSTPIIALFRLRNRSIDGLVFLSTHFRWQILNQVVYVQNGMISNGDDRGDDRAVGCRYRASRVTSHSEEADPERDVYFVVRGEYQAVAY